MKKQFQTTDQAVNHPDLSFPPDEGSHDVAVEFSPCCIPLGNSGVPIKSEPGQQCAIQVSQTGHLMQHLTQTE